MNGAPDTDIAVFTEALRLPPEERDRYLDKACKADVEFRRRVEALLQAYEQAGDFLGRPAAERPPKVAQVLAATEKPGDRIGHYKLLEQIGEGGCGVVYMAEQEEPVRRRVALKVVKPGMDTKSVIARFAAERQALALMDHPNIAHVFDAGATESGRPYFVMELVDGVKISDYCDRHSLPINARLNLFAQVCDAIQHAHQKGIIHRDIKPSNVLVTTGRDGKPVPKVIDFGIAKATDGQQLTDKTIFTAREMLIGTPAYMSPEQAALASAELDTRTDIYSLGVLLYELLTGTTPFDTRELLKAGFDEVRRVIRDEEPVRPSTRLTTMTAADLLSVSKHHGAEPPKLIREMRGELDWIVMKALEKDRGRRYQTADSLADDIHRHLENETVSARPPSRVYQFQKLVSRHKLGFAAFGIVMVTLLAGLSSTTWSLAKEKKARHEANLARGEANKEATQSKEVTRFLKEMLEGADPLNALGGDTTILREILDRAVKRLDEELTEQPAVQADLRMTIGRIYGSIGRNDKAEQVIRKALAFYRESPAGAESEISDALDLLALIHQRQARWEEAEQEGREALAIETRLPGNPRMRLVLRETHLAWAIVNCAGREAEAEKLFREALATGVRLVGEQSEYLLDTKAGLGAALKMQDKLDEAEKLFRECISFRQNKQIVNPPDVGTEMSGLASVLERKGKFDEAAQLNRQCLAIRRKILGVDHALFEKTLMDLISVLHKGGKAAEAADACGELLGMRRKRLGDEDRRVQETLAVYAELLVEGHNDLQFEQLAKEFPWVWLSRSEYLARHVRWSDAIAAASKFSEISPGDLFGYEFVALLRVQTRDRAAYEEACTKITTRFEGTAEPYTADRMATVCLLLPRPDADLKVPSELAALAVAKDSQSPGRHYFQCSKALAEFRQGHWDGATDWARKAAENPSPYTRAQAYAILAMAQSQLKQTETSRETLSKCVEIVQRQLPKLENGDLGRNWRDWIITHTLQSEAKRMIEGEPSAARPANLPP
ncbi:MAG TPA: protein kinase [Verrucomicrobiae bacterium]|nr:protein kinase [Verrucomicrobiae bacterium]